jgi:hypothetical protein
VLPPPFHIAAFGGERLFSNISLSLRLSHVASTKPLFASIDRNIGRIAREARG